MSFEEIIDFSYRTNTVDFDVYEKHNGYFSAFSKNLKDLYYNHIAPVGNTKVDSLLLSTEFIKRNCKPVICVLPISDEYDKEQLNLVNTANDAWMKFKNSVITKINIPANFSLKIIGQEYKDYYINLFARGFSSGVYGNLPEEYSEVEKLCFKEMTVNPNKHLVAMVFHNEEPIGVVRAILEKDKAMVYAFAIPKEYRFSGLTANLLGAYIIQEIFNRGVKHIFLQTEAGTILERFYTQNGFERLFLGKYYTGAKK